MSRNYDNWEKLVAAVLRREKDRHLAFCESFSSSAFSSRSSFDSNLFLGDVHFPAEVSRSSDQTPVSRDDLVIDVMKYEGSRGDEEWMVGVSLANCSNDEINNFSQLRYPNLVKLIGYRFDTDSRVLVYELMPRARLETHLFTSLDNHLFTKEGHQFLPWETRIKVAIGAARALAFLHDLETPVIHRDIKSGSIHLDADFNAKLSNFRLAIVCPESDVSVDIIGTLGYAAPEYMATGCVTTGCDVYGFGVVLVELISGLRAFDRDRQMKIHILIDWAIPYLGAKKRLSRIMDSRLRGQYPKKEAHIVGKLALQCVSSDPKLRPKMSEVVAALETLL